MVRSSQDDPDVLLIEAISQGDNQALQTLYERHGAAILNFLNKRLENRHLAEEILQDVMLAVWKSAVTFRGESQVRTWLMTIARNRATNAYNHRKPTSVELSDTMPSDAMTVSATVERGLLHEQIIDVYHQLPEDQRNAVKLVLVQGMTYPQASEVLGVPEGTVKSRLHHACQTMRRLLQMEGITHA